MSDWRALSFSQPWLDYVMRAARGEPDAKAIENRKWRTFLRGPFLLHAALSYDGDAEQWCDEAGLIASPNRGRVMERGGFAGVARLVGVLVPEEKRAQLVARGFAGFVPTPQDAPGHDLRWWMRDRYGFLLSDVRALPFTPHRGNLNFWRVPATVVASMGLPPTPEEWTPS